MSDKYNLKKQFGRFARRFRPAQILVPAKLGHPDGTIDAGKNLAWITYFDGHSEIVRNRFLPPVFGADVLVGADETSGALEIVKFRDTEISKNIIGVPAHGHTHSWDEAAGAGGYDLIWVSARQILSLRPTVSGQAVSVSAGFLLVDGQVIFFAGGSADISSHHAGGSARWVTVAINESGSLSVTDGVAKNFIDLKYSDIPAPTSGASICAVRLYNQPNLREKDLIDVRATPRMFAAVAAKNVPLDTSAFNGVLSASDANVQLAMETIDGHNHIMDSHEAVLASAHHIASSNGIWESTALAITILPGEWAFSGAIHGLGMTNGVGNGWITARLFDGTAAIPGTETLLAWCPNAEIAQRLSSSAMTKIISVSVATTITLQVSRNAPSATWTYSDVLSDSSGKSRLNAVKIS